MGSTGVCNGQTMILYLCILLALPAGHFGQDEVIDDTIEVQNEMETTAQEDITEIVTESIPPTTTTTTTTTTKATTSPKPTPTTTPTQNNFTTMKPNVSPCEKSEAFRLTSGHLVVMVMCILRVYL